MNLLIGLIKSTQTRFSIIMIPYGRQDITESDIQAVVDVLQSEFLTQGPTVEKFEQIKLL